MSPDNPQPESAPKARVLINPRLIKPYYDKHVDPRQPGKKVYQAVIGRPSRVGLFKTATYALGYAERVHVRWCRLYDVAVLALSAVEVEAVEA